ncbi:unnamed protein product [Agarophyton chilense]|eukprot:gb/GEZJ01001501.1/.p2 GENE.gb/GEZJ01001501.1/~~gb/GEZJ01001501.1/.p2  ORF type:complete len:110 (-),score=20.30 gb/GEZJ01001501.1/:492-821(-)
MSKVSSLIVVFALLQVALAQPPSAEGVGVDKLQPLPPPPSSPLVFTATVVTPPPRPSLFVTRPSPMPTDMFVAPTVTPGAEDMHGDDVEPTVTPEFEDVLATPFEFVPW